MNKTLDNLNIIIALTKDEIFYKQWKLKLSAEFLMNQEYIRLFLESYQPLQDTWDAKYSKILEED